MKSPFKLSLLALAFSNIACAEEVPLYTGDEIVVTATRTPQRTSETLVGVTVISAQEIANAGQQTMAELLQAKAGVEIRSTGGPGQPITLFLRGTNSSHVLVLVDGVRMDNITSGTTALEAIPLESIERIEVLRAPASSLYGSDAIGGVVQIFTKAGKGAPHFTLNAGLGSYNTQNVAAGYSGELGATRFQFQLGQNQSDGFSATNPAATFNYNPDRDPYRDTHFSAKVAQTLSANDEIGGTAFASDGVIHYDAGLGTDDVKNQKLRAYSVYSRNRINPVWSSLVKLGQGVDDYSFVNTSYPSSTRSLQNQASWQNDLKLDRGNLSLGIERLSQKLSSTTPYDKVSRSVNSLFVAYQGDFGAHSLLASARRDDNSQFGAHDSGNLAYGYRFNPAWRATIGAGTAFKAPSFQDLYYPGYNNPNLKPERSRNWEAGLRYAEGKQVIEARYFDNRIENLIVSPPPEYLPDNVNKARIEGTELVYNGELGGFDLNANLTLQRPRDEATGKRLRSRATEHMSLGVSKPIGDWRLGGELVASGARFDGTTEAATSRMGGYGLFNLIARYGISNELSLSARWNNVFDKQYELAQGYNTPGSNLFVSLQYQPR